MECHTRCGACCIAPSISSAIPGMPGGKPAGIRCIHLTADSQCAIFTHSDRPKVCRDFLAEKEICGKDGKEALANLMDLEFNAS